MAWATDAHARARKGSLWSEPSGGSILGALTCATHTISWVDKQKFNNPRLRFEFKGHVTSLSLLPMEFQHCRRTIVELFCDHWTERGESTVLGAFERVYFADGRDGWMGVYIPAGFSRDTNFLEGINAIVKRKGTKYKLYILEQFIPAMASYAHYRSVMGAAVYCKRPFVTQKISEMGKWMLGHNMREEMVAVRQLLLRSRLTDGGMRVDATVGEKTTVYIFPSGAHYISLSKTRGGHGIANELTKASRKKWEEARDDFVTLLTAGADDLGRAAAGVDTSMDALLDDLRRGMGEQGQGPKIAAAVESWLVEAEGEKNKRTSKKRTGPGATNVDSLQLEGLTWNQKAQLERFADDAGGIELICERSAKSTPAARPLRATMRCVPCIPRKNRSLPRLLRLIKNVRMAYRAAGPAAPFGWACTCCLFQKRAVCPHVVACIIRYDNCPIVGKADTARKNWDSRTWRGAGGVAEAQDARILEEVEADMARRVNEQEDEALQDDAECRECSGAVAASPVLANHRRRGAAKPQPGGARSNDTDEAARDRCRRAAAGVSLLDNYVSSPGEALSVAMSGDKHPGDNDDGGACSGGEGELSHVPAPNDGDFDAWGLSENFPQSMDDYLRKELWKFSI